METSVHSTVDLELDISADTFSPPDEGKLMAHCNGTALAANLTISQQVVI